MPLPHNRHCTSAIKKESRRATPLIEVAIVIVDEAMNIANTAITCMNTTLQDFKNRPHELFGNTVVLLLGDPRQPLPVVPHSTPAVTIEASLHTLPFFDSFQKLQLHEKFRLLDPAATVEPDVLQRRCEDAEWLLQLGEGKLPELSQEFRERNTPSDLIEIPRRLLLPQGSGVLELIQHVYHDLRLHYMHDGYFLNRCILTPKNIDVDEINRLVLNMIPTTTTTSYSCDSVDAALYAEEVLNQQQQTSLPSHILTLKDYMVLILLRNLNTKQGVVNGTRMIKLPALPRDSKYSLRCRLITGNNTGNIVLLPRISLSPTEGSLPFNLIRKQFPVRPCFSMTINKSQGQGFNTFGINLSNPCFSHGQLYVTLSRSSNLDNAKFRIEDGPQQGKLSNDPDNNTVYTRNVVYKNILP